jgi:hypothetical protein
MTELQFNVAQPCPKQQQLMARLVCAGFLSQLTPQLPEPENPIIELQQVLPPQPPHTCHIIESVQSHTTENCPG